MLTIAPGAELPSGTYRLGAERHARMVEALGGTLPADGSAHPLSTWLIALGGIGFGIGELFAAAGVPLEDGPMLGACRLELSRPLDAETTYDVTGRIAALEEKSGRRLGRFDVLTLELDVISAGERAARCTCSMILPR